MSEGRLEAVLQTGLKGEVVQVLDVTDVRRRERVVKAPASVLTRLSVRYQSNPMPARPARRGCSVVDVDPVSDEQRHVRIVEITLFDVGQGEAAPDREVGWIRQIGRIQRVFAVSVWPSTL